MNEADVAIKPKNLTMEEAASIPLVGLTAWQVLIDRANLKKGEKVLIHAGSGGVGTFAIQLAKHIGAGVPAAAERGDAPPAQRLRREHQHQHRPGEQRPARRAAAPTPRPASPTSSPVCSTTITG